MVGLGVWDSNSDNLFKAGLNLQVHTHSRRAENDPQLGDALRCVNPAAAADNVDVLVICVSDNAVHDVLFGRDGAAEQLQPGNIVIDCSTISPKERNRPLPS